MSDAPTCPVSYGQLQVGRIWAKAGGDPRMRPGNLQNLIHQIPQAHDLRSAIRALNVMSHILTLIMRGAPDVNNVNIPREPDIVHNGEDNNPHYKDRDWVEESRGYETQKLVNPDDETQFIEIKTLAYVQFVNENTGHRLVYKPF